MSTATQKSRAERIFEVRYPVVYLVVSLLWLGYAVAALNVVMGIGALISLALTVVSLVMRQRGVWVSEPRPPLAQESDPSLRQSR